MPDRDGKLTPEEMFNKMMEEQSRMAEARKPQPPNMPTGKPGSPPVLSAEEQRIINEMRSSPSAPRSTGMHPAQVASELPKCPECGMLHPPVKAGEKCSMAPVSIGGVANVIDVDMEINKCLVNLKNIAVSQIQSKGIKNINKLLQFMTLEMMKILEGYNEQ